MTTHRRVSLLVTLILCSTLGHCSLIVVPDEASSVQEAISETVDGDTILLRQATYRETLALRDEVRRISSFYFLTGDSADLLQTILEPADTIEADTACIFSLMEGCSLSFSGLTFRHGRGILMPNNNWRKGGAIHMERCSLGIESCLFTGCFPTFGAAVWCDSSVVMFTASRFTANGRGTFTQGVVRTYDSEVSALGCRFDHNTIQAGAAVLATRGHVEMEYCVIDSNQNGFATISPVSCDDASLNIRFCEFLDNHMSVNGTTGIHVERDAVVQDCAFRRNHGGYVLSLWGNSASVTGCVFDSNSSLVRSPSSIVLGYGSYSIDSCVFTHNSAPRWSVLTSNSTVTMTACSLGGNWSADPLGGLFMASSDSIILRDCIIEGNQTYALSTDFDWYAGVMDCRWNYWGHSSGPFHVMQNPNGLGDAISGDGVLFDPWQESPHSSAEEIPSPVDYTLFRAFPNPFNSSVTLEYEVAHEQDIKITIYDLLGREVEMMLLGKLHEGVHQTIWNAESFASGIYLARLTSSDSRHIRLTTKLLLVK